MNSSKRAKITNNAQNTQISGGGYHPLKHITNEEFWSFLGNNFSQHCTMLEIMIIIKG